MSGVQPLVRTRLGALDPLGWTFVAAGAVSLALAGKETLALATGNGGGAASVVLFASFGTVCLWVAHAISQPELDTECRECGDPLVVDSAADGVDAAVTVQFANPPERVGVGPFMVVQSRDRTRFQYCSATCARADLGPLRETTTVPTVESSSEPVEPEVAS